VFFVVAELNLEEWQWRVLTISTWEPRNQNSSVGMAVQVGKYFKGLSEEIYLVCGNILLVVASPQLPAFHLLTISPAFGLELALATPSPPLLSRQHLLHLPRATRPPLPPLLCSEHRLAVILTHQVSNKGVAVDFQLLQVDTTNGSEGLRGGIGSRLIKLQLPVGRTRGVISVPRERR
jgi:hypothetical protein